MSDGLGTKCPEEYSQNKISPRNIYGTRRKEHSDLQSSTTPKYEEYSNISNVYYIHTY